MGVVHIGLRIVHHHFLGVDGRGLREGALRIQEDLGHRIETEQAEDPENDEVGAGVVGLLESLFAALDGVLLGGVDVGSVLGALRSLRHYFI